ncbi:hypothetical protein [Aurantivibrio infirmus]
MGDIYVLDGRNSAGEYLGFFAKPTGQLIGPPGKGSKNSKRKGRLSVAHKAWNLDNTGP